ncbi:hypothetical protein [Psychroserpens damuponensis]|uniref:hypothetical protein n=1 Tax=Psychroserpens damuponensis TaxID=943936 RepID=UPI00058E451C|nr:hypothetical protein [Psychroserpens damuponensis]
MSKLKLSCQEASHICDKNQYKEANFREKVILTIHLIYCRACRKYTSRNSKLSKLVSNPKVKTMDVSAKEKLNAAFQKELANHQ